MYFPNAFKKSFLTASGAITLASSNSTNALTAGQLGFFAPTSATNSTLAVVSSSTTKPFYFVQGSYFSSDKIGTHGGYKESIKSKLINPRFISRVIKLSAKTAQQHVIKVSAAAGANVSGLAQDSTYRLRIDVKGSPALRFLTHNAYKTLDYYTGCVSSNPSFVRDPVLALLNWKDQINSTPFLKDLVQARAFKYVASITASGAGTSGSTTQITIPTASTTGVLVGQRITGAGLPGGAMVTTVTANTSVVVKFPPQSATVATTASAYKVWSDLYTALDPVTGLSVLTTATLVPSTAVATGATIAASASGALTYSGDAEVAAGTGFGTSGNEPFMELYGAYAETAFGSCTFTPSDKYEVEPLYLYAAVVDESGNPCAATPFVANTATVSATNPYLSSHGVEVTAPIQAQGSGEAVLRDLINSGRYLQNAYPDSSRVDSLRMREIEADPMLGTVTRANGYDCILVLHNVPRWNNPSGTYDNDQYLLCIWTAAGTTTTGVTDFFINSANAVQGTSALALESY